MLSNVKNRFGTLEDGFSTTVQDKFGESIVSDEFHPMVEEVEKLQQCFQEAERDQNEIQKFLRELRAIK